MIVLTDFAILMADYYIVNKTIQNIANTLTQWAVVIAAFALGLGLLNLVKIQGRHVIKRTPGRWYYSLWTLAIAAFYVTVGLSLGQNHSIFTWIYNTMYVRTQAAIFTLLAFYIASAAYRVLRVRNRESLLLLASGALVMLSNAPIGPWLWSGFLDIGNWIQNIVTAGTFRAIIMGVSLGLLGLGFRVLIGRERRALGATGE